MHCNSHCNRYLGLQANVSSALQLITATRETKGYSGRLEPGVVFMSGMDQVFILLTK